MLKLTFFDQETKTIKTIIKMKYEENNENFEEETRDFEPSYFTSYIRS